MFKSYTMARAWQHPGLPHILVACALVMLTSQAHAAITPEVLDGAHPFPAVDFASVAPRGADVAARKLLTSPPTYQEQVQAAVLKTFNYLIGSNSGARNPLQALNVPCQEFQLKGELKDGPYYLTAVFEPPTPVPDLPAPVRACKFKPGIPVLVTVGDVICTALCSAQTTQCDCCDGSVGTHYPSMPDSPSCPVTNRIDCSYCDDATRQGYFDPFLNQTGSSATLTDVSTGATTALALASISVGPDHVIQLTPNSYYRAPGGLITYGPDAIMIGRPLYVGVFALIDPALLQPGHSYRVSTIFPGYNNGHPVAYDFEVHKN